MLPEYLVEFDYVLKNQNQNKIADFGDTVTILDNPDDEFISPKNIQIYKSELNNIYNTLCDEINAYQFENLEDLKHPNLEIKAQDLDRADITSIKTNRLNYFKYCLSRSTLYELNPNLLNEGPQTSPSENQILNNRRPESIQFLNLSNQKLLSVLQFPNLVNLRTLILSYNKIQEITGLECYANLVHLDLSHNEILRVTNLSKLPRLEILDISHNDIQLTSDINELKKNPSLNDLKIIFNPFAEK